MASEDKLERVRRLVAHDDLESAELSADELRELLRLVDEGQELRGAVQSFVHEIELGEDEPVGCKRCGSLATVWHNTHESLCDHCHAVLGGPGEDRSYSEEWRVILAFQSPSGVIKPCTGGR